MLSLASRVTLNIHRYYFSNQCLSEKPEVVLHGFCDSSKKAYAAVIYVTTTTSKNITGHFVACNTKVVPVKLTSILRLELCSCLLLANLMSSVVLALTNVVHILEIYCWNDSLDSLFWIKEKHKKRNIFVQITVKSIRDALPSANLRYCLGERNPADLPLRGNVKEADADIIKKWIDCPDFIYKPCIFWPDNNSAMETDKNLYSPSACDDISTSVMVGRPKEYPYPYSKIDVILDESRYA